MAMYAHRLVPALASHVAAGASAVASRRRSRRPSLPPFRARLLLLVAVVVVLVEPIARLDGSARDVRRLRRAISVRATR